MELHNSFVSKTFLRSVLDHDYQRFRGSADEADLLARLTRWAARPDLGERSAEPAFMEEFFRQTWGYVQGGQAGADQAFTMFPQFAVRGGAAGGGVGSADAALGYFPPDRQNHIPQVLCEFKDIRNKGLDAPQRRKNDNRSPVQQGLGYLAASRRGLFGSEPILPMWAIITDMNEFRLYWADRGERQSIRFTITPRDLFQGQGLLADSEEARFDRFLFFTLFHRDTLTVQGDTGRPRLHGIIAQQRFQQRDLENTYYAEYKAFRNRLYQTLLDHNGPETDRFPGTKGRLVRLAQKLLDRSIFVFFCEDMGRVLGFPPQLLRDFLTSKSSDQFYDRTGDEIWTQLRRLFTAMNDGTAFGGHQMNRFNGGLFAADPLLDRLHIPNLIFCEQGQGQNDGSLHTHKETLLYLCAAYNYASGWTEGLARAPGGPQAPEAGREERRLGLYTLGRIFEQSITELEILEAEADGRVSLNTESKRKRDGVYYTPEWVVDRIVAETVGERLADLKIACGWPRPGTPDLPDQAAVRAYSEALREIKIVDPACGSGAFLITTLRYLLDEWKALRDLRRGLFNEVAREEEDVVIAEILSRSIYGVDINPSSVEIAKLALWLHTARGNRPLSSLDDHIVGGNSLIGPEFYQGLAEYNDDERERINAFDWWAAFPEVLERGGFDAVIGNPPYVKLQNFRKVHADMAGYLARRVDEGGRYRSTQTGNFDLFLPFIERGIELLNDQGRLGYIAPSLWTVSEYGQALRELVAEGGHLNGWIDFGAFQVFEEATTYTALQFFSRTRSDAVRIATSRDGYIPEEPWAGPDTSLPYPRLPYADRWLMLTGAERNLIDRMAATCVPLGDRRISRAIFVGLQTSADQIYQLTKRGPGRYICSPKGRAAPPPFEVRIEDAIMKPLVSGVEAKRYIEAQTDTYLLFPYRVDDAGAHLIPAADIARDCPNAWAYLRRWEAELRARENSGFDDDQWWRFGRHQSLDKQEISKVVVPRLVASLSCSTDQNGLLYLDNVDVGGVAPANGVSPFFLTGVLNGKVANFVFRRTSKPFRGEYRSANKQYIEPIPIPNATDAQRADIAQRAEGLQNLHSARRDTLMDIARRFQANNARPLPDSWLFPDLPTPEAVEATAPEHLGRVERRAWVRTARDKLVEQQCAQLGQELIAGATMDASYERGELRFFIDGVAVIERIFVNEAEGAFILAQWKVIASTFTITEKTTGKKLAEALRRVAPAAPEPLRSQVIALVETLTNTERDTATAEAEMNRRLYVLYGLTAAEIALVERG